VEVSANERFTAGEADFLHAMGHEQSCEPCDLLEAEDLVSVEEDVVRTKDLFRHAVGAAEVAAIRDGDAKVAQGTLEGVEESHEVSLAGLGAKCSPEHIAGI